MNGLGGGWALFATVFGVIFVAELPDKTALAALALATRHRPLPVIVGAGVALTIQSIVAVAAGQLFALLPPRPVHVASGLVFLVSAVLMWRRRADDDGETRDTDGGFWRSAWVVFAVIFVAEWGDLTQLATAALAARTHAPWIVLGGSVLALWAVATLAVLVGHRAGRLLPPRITARIAAVVFVVVGIVLLVGAV